MTKSSLLTVARQQLRLARYAADGRSRRLVCGSWPDTMRQSVVALIAGQVLGSDGLTDSAGWTVQVLQGRVRYSTAYLACVGWPGDLLVGTQEQHQIIADRDTVLLLTSAHRSAEGDAFRRARQPDTVHLPSTRRGAAPRPADSSLSLPTKGITS